MLDPSRAHPLDRVQVAATQVRVLVGPEAQVAVGGLERLQHQRVELGSDLGQLSAPLGVTDQSSAEVVLAEAQVAAFIRDDALEDLAGDYHRFYDSCRVLPMGDEEPADLHRARLALCDATRQVIANGLGILGVSAPERM